MKHADDPIQQQIEAYLNQEMSDLDRSRFEKLIHEDPELHEEVELQESMMEAIRAERMLALKAGLSSVNISLWSTGLLEIAKIAAIATGISVSAFIGYELYTAQSSDSQKNQKQEVVKSPAEKEAKPDQSEISLAPGVEEEKASQSFESKPGHANDLHDSKSTEKPAHPIVSRASDSHPGSAKVARPNQAPEVLQNSAEGGNGTELNEPTVKSAQSLSTKDVVLPTDGITNKSSLESVHPEVVIKRDNKDRFHYQFSDNKLVLYADFSDKLYEVLELNQDNTKRIFFAYDTKFYQLNPNQLEIAPLKEVQDNSLIQILRAYQKRKN